MVQKITRLLLCTVIACSLESCATRSPERVSFTIDENMDPKVWYLINSIDQPQNKKPESLSKDFIRKIEPGTIIRADCFGSTQANSTARYIPLHYTFNIPIRKIESKHSLGTLKGYEKAFLMTCIATNTKQMFNKQNTKLISDKALINLWNYFIDNMYIAKLRDSLRGDYWPTGIYINYTKINDSLFKKDSTFHALLGKNCGLEPIIKSRTNVKSINKFLNESLEDGITNSYYYYIDKNDKFFSYVSFTANINGLAYGCKEPGPEAGSWSVYDWVHSGIPFYKNDAGETKHVKSISFRGKPFNLFSKKFKVVDSLQVKNWIIHYHMSGEQFIEQAYKSGSRTISEKDLINIFPASVYRIELE